MSFVSTGVIEFVRNYLETEEMWFHCRIIVIARKDDKPNEDAKGETISRNEVVTEWDINTHSLDTQ